MKIPLFDIVESPELQEYVKKKKWKNQGVRKPVIAQNAGKLCNKPVDMSKGSQFENLSHMLSRKLKSTKIPSSQFPNKER